jgi:hypothetical protein
MESHPLGYWKSLIYKSSNSGEQLFIKVLRLIDTYINITGYHCYGLDKIKESFLIIFLQVVLRPYSGKLRFIEHLRFWELRAMTYAAKKTFSVPFVVASS